MSNGNITTRVDYIPEHLRSTNTVLGTDTTTTFIQKPKKHMSSIEVKDIGDSQKQVTLEMLIAEEYVKEYALSEESIKVNLGYELTRKLIDSGLILFTKEHIPSMDVIQIRVRCILTDKDEIFRKISGTP